MTNDFARLLGRAEAVLDGRVQLPKARAARVAAWFGRAALEARVDDMLAAHAVIADGPTMRTKLACLQVLNPDHADHASIAWWALSRCCHHHAYELSPTAGEVRHCLALVKRLALDADG